MKILLCLDIWKILVSPLSQPVVRLLYNGSCNCAARDTALSALYVNRYTHYFHYDYSSRLSVAHVTMFKFFPKFRVCGVRVTSTQIFFLFLTCWGEGRTAKSLVSLFKYNAFLDYAVEYFSGDSQNVSFSTIFCVFEGGEVANVSLI